MYKQKLFHFLVLIWTFCFFNAKAQIVATPSTGCAPLSVVFSGPSGASNPYWTLGSGMGTSNLASPNVLYTIGGTYNITYTALVGGSPVSYNTQVIVKSVPTASFSYILPSSRCFPMVVNFNASGSSANPLYTWSFGDLTPLGTGATVSHTYNFANNFIPVMTVLDVTSQCTAVATALSNGTIYVSAPPVINLTSSNGYFGCTAPFVTSLDASGSISGSPIPFSGNGLSFNWSIPGGTPSSASSSNAGSVSFGSGTHTLTIIATDNNQCSSSTSTFVTVAPPYMTAIVPPTVCINAPVPATIHTSYSTATFVITNSASPITTVVNQGVPTVIDTVCIFTSPGLTTMTINVPTGLGCPVLSSLIPIFVEEIIANFIPTPSVSTCASLATITFSNTSSVNNSSSLTYNWTSFWNPVAAHHGAPTATTLTTPASVTFTFWQGSLSPYTNYQYLTPAIDLAIISSPTGCKTHTNIAGYFKMARPTARFRTDKKEGCAPLVVNYNSTSMYNPDFDLDYYKWYSGISATTFSSGSVPPPPSTLANLLPNATFTYATPGTYYASLKISTTGGCTDSSYVDTITVVSPPTNLSAIFPTQVCAGQPVTINMSATAGTTVPSSSGIDHWHVTTDEKYFSGCFTNSSPTFSFTHLGVHNVEIMASQAGCESSNTLMQTITVNGPIGKFTHETNCDINRKMIKFHVHLEEASSAILYYGDGTQETIAGNLTGLNFSIHSHTYALTGNYTATLITTNGSNACPPYVYTKLIKVRDAKARITFNGQPLPVYPAPLSCTKARIAFSSSTSTDYSGCFGAFTWFFQSPSTSNPATPGLTMSPLSLSGMSFAGYSVQISPTIVSWLYVVPALKDTFRTTGTYTIGLRVKDDNNCVDTEMTPFRISNAEPVFTITPNPACFANGTVQLTNYTDANQVFGDVITSYNWYFGDGTTWGSSSTGLSTITHSIPGTSATSPYTPPIPAILIAQNQIGCTDTAVVNWQVNNPFPNYAALGSSVVCIPMFSAGHYSVMANVGYPTYSVTFGTPSVNPQWYTLNSFSNISHPYTIPGTYTSVLKVIDSAGCIKNDTLLVKAIGQPTASLFAVDGRDKFCIPGDPHLKSSSVSFINPINGYSWTYATPTSTITSPAYTLDTYDELLPAAVIYTISLTVSVDGHCPSSATKTLGVYNPTATAVLSPTMFCLGNTINAGINIIDGVQSWQWFFGDNVQQQLLGPFSPTQVSYPYTIYPTTSTNGSAVVQLVYNSPSNGCSRVINIPIQVIKLESDFKRTGDLYKHCLGVRDTFISTTPNPLFLNLNYDWNYGDLSTGNGQQVSHTYLKPGTYTVSMTAKDLQYACTSTTVKSMTVFPLPTAQLRIDKTLSCPNATFEVQGNGSPGISGFVTATLSPVSGGSGMNLAPTNSFTSSTSASVNTIYTLTVSDENSCKSDPVFDTMFIQLPAPRVDWDTAVIIGQTTPLNAFLGNAFTYTWSPLITNLNCDTCIFPNPISNSMVDITYTVMVEDTLKCSIVKNTFTIKIIPKVSLDVPTAFTPNGDGVNDFIFPAGWGIKKLIYFKVFNRWGQQIFESNDLNVGWDGNFGGVPQNMETYVYQVSVETYLETEPTLFKTGTFKLIR
jgi:gliding motility-associated-like protein